MKNIKGYQLLKLIMENETIINELYHWSVREEHPERYTCRPVQSMGTFIDYLKRARIHVDKGVITYYLTDRENKEILGKITLFDYNERNQSAEFGYYIPEEKRKKGYGSIMILLFLKEVFLNESINLNKVYATTASGNTSSIRLLVKNNFMLDGRLREHYWFKDEVQDQLHYSLLRKDWIY
jgi:RimJ/RimL family protein N-acetyltransferase